MSVCVQMACHDFLLYGVPISLLCDQCVWTLLAEGGLLQIFEIPHIQSKLKNLGNLGNSLWSIPTAYFWAPYSNCCVNVVFCEAEHSQTFPVPRGARGKDCWEKVVCLSQLPTSELCLCSIPASCQVGSCRCTLHLLSVVDQLGVEICFSYVPNQEKSILKAHCLMLHNVLASTVTSKWEDICCLSRTERKKTKRNYGLNSFKC